MESNRFFGMSLKYSHSGPRLMSSKVIESAKANGILYLGQAEPVVTSDASNCQKIFNYVKWENYYIPVLLKSKLDKFNSDSMISNNGKIECNIASDKLEVDTIPWV